MARTRKGGKKAKKGLAHHIAAFKKVKKGGKKSRKGGRKRSKK